MKSALRKNSGKSIETIAIFQQSTDQSTGHESTRFVSEPRNHSKGFLFWKPNTKTESSRIPNLKLR